ncbi:PREDICTED: uncharacterized protein LOC106111847 isoform X1 [Papilio polytes]|uniref:uncharacterized protein LOC106111847 isoform X1 n=1 Tax=Papilio polytes TaxID=76194 RepID=UPI000675CEB3|nr:PREDICTED: uncharacterized protein LOC106111847 isoform X1 [Papilio polytes]
MEFKVLILVTLICAASCLPLGSDGNDLVSSGHRLWKRFINPSVIFGNFADTGINNIRTKRSSEDECEKLQLCKLHARSHYSFFAAYELYFVNKENARLWDHQTHTMADCERRFSGCYK